MLKINHNHLKMTPILLYECDQHAMQEVTIRNPTTYDIAMRLIPSR